MSENFLKEYSPNYLNFTDRVNSDESEYIGKVNCGKPGSGTGHVCRVYYVTHHRPKITSCMLQLQVTFFNTI